MQINPKGCLRQEKMGQKLQDCLAAVLRSTCDFTNVCPYTVVLLLVNEALVTHVIHASESNVNILWKHCTHIVFLPMLYSNS